MRNQNRREGPGFVDSLFMERKKKGLTNNELGEERVKAASVVQCGLAFKNGCIKGKRKESGHGMQPGS